MNLRCFVGVALPAAVSDSLEVAASAIRRADPRWEREKWVARDSLHVTVCFIGAVDAARLDSLAEALEEAVRPAAPFTLDAPAIAARPSLRQARLIWVSFRDASARGAALADAVGTAAASFGAELSERPFTAHATLCRSRHGRPLAAAALEAADLVLSGVSPSMSVAEATLYSSRLTPLGAVYETLASWKLSGG